jgi:replicative DNA helicase
MVQPHDGPALPISYEAEQALLGALLVNETVYDQVGDFLRPEHFADVLHGRIYEAIAVMVNAGQKPDVLRVAQHFEHSWPNVGRTPAQYLAGLASAVVTIMGADGYARTILDLWQRRAAMQDMAEMSVRFADVTVDTSAASLIEEAEKRLGDIASTHGEADQPVSLLTATDEALRDIEAAMQRGDGLSGVTTGLKDLDEALGGLHRSDLIILAGRPGQGKTALGTNIATACARAALEIGGHGGPVYFANLEMKDRQLASRVLAQMTGISTDAQRRGRLDAEDFRRLMEARAELAAWPLWIDDNKATTIQGIRSRARRHARRHGGLALLVVDYLQLMVTGRASDRVAETSKISRDLKILAGELDVPVLALAQLSRQVESRENKRPILADLRESGAIEQDADEVMFIYREEMYLRAAQPDPSTDRHAKWQADLDKARGKAEIIVAKNRLGPVATIYTHWNGAAGRFGDLSRQESML